MPAGIAPRARRSPIFMYAQLVRTRKYTPQCGASWYYTARTPACQTPRTRVCLFPKVNGGPIVATSGQVAVNWPNSTWSSCFARLFEAIAPPPSPACKSSLFFSTILPHTAAHREPRRRYALPTEAIAARYLAFRAQARIYLTGPRVSLGPFEKKQSAHYREKVTAFFALKEFAD